MSAATLIRRTREAFAAHGVPLIWVCDNGPQFVSQEFREFLANNSVELLTTAPYTPFSNGLAERCVWSFKDLLAKHSDGTWEERVTRVLFCLRTAPCSSTGQSPAERFLGRRLRTPLDVMVPQMTPVKPDVPASIRAFTIGDPVLFLDYRVNWPKWSPGTITSRSGAVMYNVVDEWGVTHKRRVNQMRPRPYTYTSAVQAEFPAPAVDPRWATLEDDPLLGPPMPRSRSLTPPPQRPTLEERKPETP